MPKLGFAQDPDAPCSIQQYAPKMFSQESNQQFIQTALFDNHGTRTQVLKNNDEFLLYLANEKLRENGVNKKDSMVSENLPNIVTSFCILAPRHGWGRIPIMEENMQHLGKHFGVNQFFYKYLSCFGVKGFPRDEGFSGFDIRFEEDDTGSISQVETCYLLKYVEPKDNSTGNTNNPWSIRHALIYQNTLTKLSRNNYILVRPSQRLCQSLKTFSLSSLKEQQEASRHWTQTHTMFFDQIAEQWRLYINYLDQETEVLFDRVDFVEVEPSPSHETTFITNSVRDMKRLSYLTDQALRVSLNLDLNTEVFSLLLQASKDARALEESSMAIYYDRFECCLRSELSANKFLKMTVSTLLKRQALLCQELRDLMVLRNTEVNKQMARSSNQGTNAIVELSENASQEARIVKVLTILAVIFVPASFVADFMQMGFITIAQAEGFKITADKGLWFYAILTMPLVIITIAIYIIFEISSKRKRRDSTIKC